MGTPLTSLSLEGFEPATPWSRIENHGFAYPTRDRMHRQAVDFAALALRPFLARVARSVRKLPAMTAKRLQNASARTR